MVTQGVFGYILGKKKRITHVQNDADLLWQILVREIYILMKHFGSKESLKEAFEKIKPVKGKPKQIDIEKCKVFTDLEGSNKSNKSKSLEEWSCILKWCQSSYINLLESGYIINQKEEYGLIFILDLNNYSVRYYDKKQNNNINILDTATIEEIMEFDDMPKKSYTEIVYEMNANYKIWNQKYSKVNDELEKLNKLKEDVKSQGAINIEDKLDKLIYDTNFERIRINVSRRFFYYRLKALDLIEEEKSNLI